MPSGCVSLVIFLVLIFLWKQREVTVNVRIGPHGERVNIMSVFEM